MKSIVFQSALQVLASTMEEAGLNEVAKHITDFGTAFIAPQTVTLGKRLQQFQDITLGSGNQQPLLGALQKLILPVTTVVDLVGNSATKSECEELRKFLQI